MNRVEQMKKIQNEALELFAKKILITATHLLNMELSAFYTFGHLKRRILNICQ